MPPWQDSRIIMRQQKIFHSQKLPSYPSSSHLPFSQSHVFSMTSPSNFRSGTKSQSFLMTQAPTSKDIVLMTMISLAWVSKRTTGNLSSSPVLLKRLAFKMLSGALIYEEVNKLANVDFLISYYSYSQTITLASKYVLYKLKYGFDMWIKREFVSYLQAGTLGRFILACNLGLLKDFDT